MSSANLLKCQDCGNAKVWLLDGIDMSLLKTLGEMMEQQGALVCTHCDYPWSCCTDWVMGHDEPVRIDYLRKQILSCGWKPRQPMSGEVVRPTEWPVNCRCSLLPQVEPPRESDQGS